MNLEECQCLDTIADRSTQCFYTVDYPWLYDSLKNKLTPLYFENAKNKDEPKPRNTIHLPFVKRFLFPLKINTSYGSSLFETF